MTDRLPDDPTSDLKTERLNEMAFSFKQAGTLLAAIDLGVFTAISEGAGTVEAIAAKVSVDPEAVDRLLIACKALDLVREVDGSYRNLSDVERYAVRGSRTYFGDYLAYQARSEYDRFKDLTSHLKPAEGQEPPKRYAALMADADEARRFTVAGYNASLSLGHKLAKTFDFSRFDRWLDLGGGSGCYSIAACERNPSLCTVIMDFPNVLAVTCEFVAKHGLEQRIETHAGNFFEDDLPTGCDLVSYVTPLQSYMPDEVTRALRRARETVARGGTVLVLDYMLDDDKAGPLDPAFTNLQGVREGHFTGRVNSGAEFRSYMQAAGLVDIEVQWFMRHQLGLVTGRNPA
ncbi:MAG: methyltransferase [Acidobacteriota bacterium]|nr:methyltransferase [Acidobacteriota bacterium]